MNKNLYYDDIKSYVKEQLKTIFVKQTNDANASYKVDWYKVSKLAEQVENMAANTAKMTNKDKTVAEVDDKKRYLLFYKVLSEIRRYIFKDPINYYYFSVEKRGDGTVKEVHSGTIPYDDILDYIAVEKGRLVLRNLTQLVGIIKKQSNINSPLNLTPVQNWCLKVIINNDFQYYIEKRMYRVHEEIYDRYKDRNPTLGGQDPDNPNLYTAYNLGELSEAWFEAVHKQVHKHHVFRYWLARDYFFGETLKLDSDSGLSKGDYNSDETGQVSLKANKADILDYSTLKGYATQLKEAAQAVMESSATRDGETTKQLNDDAAIALQKIFGDVVEKTQNDLIKRLKSDFKKV